MILALDLSLVVFLSNQSNFMSSGRFPLTVPVGIVQVVELVVGALH